MNENNMHLMASKNTGKKKVNEQEKIRQKKRECPESEYVIVDFLFQLIFIFHLFLGMVIYANEFKI